MLSLFFTGDPPPSKKAFSARGRSDSQTARVVNWPLSNKIFITS
jgi:hypothetical protein